MCKGIQGLINEGIVQGCDKQKNKDFENVTLSIMELQNVSREDAEKQARLLLKMD